MPGISLKVRRPIFSFQDVPRYPVLGDAVATHFFNGLSLVFPDGERFFVKAMYDNLDAVRDRELVTEIRAFAGQEGQHAHQHQEYFAVLRAQGYEIDGFLQAFRRYCEFVNTRVPARVRLAWTAGVEHHTATFSAIALESGALDGCFPAVRALIAWHAAEEIEHKAVAYDALMEVRPGYLHRMFGFALGTATVFTWVSAGTALLLWQDRKAGRPLPKPSEITVGGLLRKSLVGMARYLKPGFHPRQIRDDHLIGTHLQGVAFAS